MVTARTFVSSPIALPAPDQIRAAGQAMIDFTGIDQAGPSFEARVFLNRPDADANTPTTPENGYAGSFHVYGYGLWSSGQETAADTPAPPSKTAELPMQRSLIATEALLQAASNGSTAIVTIVPILPGTKANLDQKVEEILTVEKILIHTSETKP